MQALAAYQIPDSNVTELRAKVLRLARRASRTGTTPLRLIEHRPDVRVKYVCERRVELPCTWCELEGDSPVIAGHTFIARIEHTEAGNLVSRVGGDEALDLTAYRTAKNTCAHCHTTRARRDTFVLQTPEGELIQIGRNCLADFLRTDDAEGAVRIAEMIAEFSRVALASDDEGGYGGGWRSVITVADFLACACASIRRDGWVRKSSDDFHQPTSSVALWLAGPKPMGDSAQAWRDGQPMEADVARAALVVAWIQASTDTSDYMHNLRVAVGKDPGAGMNMRTAGLLASAPAMYARHVEKEEAARRARETHVDAGHFGEVGKRYDIGACTVTGVRHIPGEYGVTTLLMFTDAAGHALKWFASGERDADVGEVWDIRGTVKKHDEYKGVKQTMLSRCVLNRVEND